MKILAKRTGLGNQILFLQILEEIKLKCPPLLYTDSQQLAELSGLNYNIKNKAINFVLYGYSWRKLLPERLKNPFGKFYGFKHRMFGRFWGIGYNRSILYNENLHEIDNLRRLFGIPIKNEQRKEGAIAFIIGHKKEKSYPHWYKLYSLFKNYEVRIFDKNIDLPGYVNTPDLKKLKYELRLCDFYIAEDTGVMHLADSMGLPGLVIFGGTSIIKNKPLCGDVIWKDIDCRPCYNWGRTKCKTYECLDIEPIKIYNKFKECLKDNSY